VLTSDSKFHTRCPHATDLCRSTRPVLDGTAHQVACHHHHALPPPDLPIARTGTRSPAAEARFALYRAATNEKPNNKETTT
jgi:peptide/nickel transport system ATP-binding protein